MKKRIKDVQKLRNSVDGFFSTLDEAIKSGELTKEDRQWLKEELTKMETMLLTFKSAQNAASKTS